MGLRRLDTLLNFVGFYPQRLVDSFFSLPAFLWGLYLYFIQGSFASGYKFDLSILPILCDVKKQAGSAKGHYFCQDLWAARRIYRNKPKQHIDVGSRIDGFISHLLTFMDVTVIDVRPGESSVSGLSFLKMDIMDHKASRSIQAESVSCLHAIEHFGLGRYGDPIDRNGWNKGLGNIASMVTPGGRLYLSAPIGKQVVEFNAQRIFAPNTLIDAASKYGLKLHAFSYVDDHGDFHELTRIEESIGCQYGCGCYEFVKPG